MKKFFSFGFALFFLVACQQTEKRSVSSSSDTNILRVKKPKAKKKITEKIRVDIVSSPTFEDSINEFFKNIDWFCKENMTHDSMSVDDGFEKHFVLKKNENDSITQTLFVRTKAADEDSVKNDCYFIWYSYQNTMSAVDTAQDISLVVFKDSTGNAQFIPISFEQYLIQDSLKESKNALFYPSSFELRKSDLKEMFALFKRK